MVEPAIRTNGWERALMAAERVKARLRRATRALDAAGVHLLFTGEKARGDNAFPAPDLDESERAAEFQVVSLEALVRMKLIAGRAIDSTHLRDLSGVGLLDATWPARLPPPLGARLQQLLDDPNG
jgi:hypothetical protein